MSTLYRHGEFGKSKGRHEGLYTAVRSVPACRVDTLTRTLAEVDVRTVVYGALLTMC